MSHESHPKVAFVGWNPIQFLLFAPVIARLPGAEAVIEKKRGVWKSLDLAALGVPAGRVHHFGPRQMHRLDGRYDVIVCQTPFSGIGELRHTRVAMLQYGYAKEAHNYGAWRSFADVCMTYGPYASRKLAPFAPCITIGNPRFESWLDPKFHRRAHAKYASMLDPTRRTVLYAPTWGELSSHDRFADAVAALANEFNVLIKMHHISVRFGHGRGGPLRRKFTHFLGAEQDLVELLSVADVLLSDFSGAIFDAIQAQVPVILLGTAAAEGQASSDRHSMEQARRGELGSVVATPDDLARTVHQVLSTEEATISGLATLREDLFADAAGASERAVKVILDLADGHFRPAAAHAAIRDETRAHFRTRNRFRSIRSVRRILVRGWGKLRRMR